MFLVFLIWFLRFVEFVLFEIGIIYFLSGSICVVYLYWLLVFIVDLILFYFEFYKVFDCVMYIIIMMCFISVVCWEELGIYEFLVDFSLV